MTPKTAFDGPIPGENYTSDTRNYPWHRPPDYNTIDDAIEGAVKQLTEKDATFGLITMLENELTVAQAATVYVIAGVGSGKWTPDYALLLAGPVARVMQMLAEGYGIDYDMGLDGKEPRKTSAYYKAINEIDEEKAEEVSEEVSRLLDAGEEDPEEMSGGFMSMPDDVETGIVEGA